MFVRKLSHESQLGAISRDHHYHVWNHSEIGKVKAAVVSWTINSDESCTVQGKANR